MNTKIINSIKLAALAALALTLSPSSVMAADIRQPHLDKDGRFYVYKPTTPGAIPPYVPYGVMPDEAGPMITVDVTNRANPFIPENAGAADTNITCINVRISWRAPFWCGCAFISGRDKPQWWGKDDQYGWYYDLSRLHRKKLVFHARSNNAQNTRIQVKVGVLGDQKYGDSMALPAETSWLKLTPKWTRYELDLSDQNLSRVCNGFTFVSNQDQNEGASETSFSLSEIYFE